MTPNENPNDISLTGHPTAVTFTGKLTQDPGVVFPNGDRVTQSELAQLRATDRRARLAQLFVQGFHAVGHDDERFVEAFGEVLQARFPDPEAATLDDVYDALEAAENALK